MDMLNQPMDSRPFHSDRRLGILILCSCLLFGACTERPTHLPEKEELVNPFYTQAYAYRDSQQLDSAFRYFYQAKDLFVQQNDSFGAGKSLVNMAFILLDRSDYFGTQETAVEALNYLDTTNQVHHHYLATNFNTLGIATYELRDYANALQFYDAAVRFSDDSLNARIYLNNKARVYQAMENYPMAIALYEQILSENSKSTLEYARARTNLAVARRLQNPGYDARPSLWEALHIRLRENDRWGQNSSYAHLTDYYAGTRIDSALYYAKRRYELASELQSADDRMEALAKLIELSPSEVAKSYFETYRALNDSVQLARNAAKNQFALIRYEVEKSRAENLALQQENTEKAYQINRQRMWTALVLTLAVMLLAGGLYWYRKRKQRLELETRNRINAHRLKTSKKIHDVVANGLYRVMTELENQPDINQESILDRLEDMYEKSRDISYETETATVGEDFAEKVSNLLRSFATDATAVFIVGNDAELWAPVDILVRHEVEHILQELMVNMRKHSRASKVVVQFERAQHEVSIDYKDNGVGLPDNFKRGNGLRNTGNRIESLRGSITFDSDSDNGLKIQLVFPVA